MSDRSHRHTAGRDQTGVVTLEYAFLLMVAILPLLLFTFTGTLIFAAKQSLSLAAAEGSRAALRHGNLEQRQANACAAARRSMQWLLNFSGQTPDCLTADSGSIRVSAALPCEDGSAVRCIRVTVSYDYDQHPFIPGTGALFGWTIGQRLQSQAVVQIDSAML